MSIKEFTQFISIRDLSIQASDLKSIYDEVMNIVEEVESVDTRIQILSYMGYQIIITDYYGRPRTSSPQREPRLFFRRRVGQVIYTFSCNLDSNGQIYPEKSFYIQISRNRVILNHFPDEISVAFIEVLTTLRQIKH